MKKIISVGVFFLCLFAFFLFYRAKEDYNLTEQISFLQGFMHGHIYVTPDRKISFNHYDNQNIKYNKTLDSTCNLLKKTIMNVQLLENNKETLPVFKSIRNVLQQKKILKELTDEQKKEFEIKKNQLINRLYSEETKLEIITRAFQDFILDELPEKAVLIDQLQKLDPKILETLCGDSSIEECAERSLAIAENRNQLIKAFNTKNANLINEASKKQLSSTNQDEPINEIIEGIIQNINS